MARIASHPTLIWELSSLHSRGVTGQDTTIAILDGGIDLNHMSLNNRLISQDINGRDFVNDSHGWYGPIARDAHGMAVAALAGGRGFTRIINVNTTENIPDGVAPQAKLYICRVFHNQQEYNIVSALQHIIDVASSNQGCIDIVCMSFKLSSKTEFVEDLLSQLSQLGVVCVAAAGNLGELQTGVNFPASDPNVLAVGALKPLGQKSCLNPNDGSGIDVFAPGEDVVVPSPENETSVILNDGTSYSTPIVAGFLSLLIQCAKATNNEKVIKKYHDVKFLRQLFCDHRLCKDRKLLHVNQFLSDIHEGHLSMVSLIQKVYPKFNYYVECD